MAMSWEKLNSVKQEDGLLHHGHRAGQKGGRDITAQREERPRGKKQNEKPNAQQPP